MNNIKEAFQKVREDIDFLKKELEFLRANMIDICEIIKSLTKKESLNDSSDTSTHLSTFPTTSTHLSTDKALFNPLKAQNLPISTGNEGVSTDKQTDRQTDKSFNFSKNSLENASEILNSLDNIKKELRLKLKRLTEQEFLIFSTIYQFDKEKGFSDYKILSKKLNLSESSIRDYVRRLISKGIPIHKKRINNKSIQLNISFNLKKIASLSTLLYLREI